MEAKSVASTLREVVAPNPRFQRAVNLKHDLGDVHQVAAYVPTASGAAAIQTVARGAMQRGEGRANVLVGPYGSGKTHLAVFLAALLSREARCYRALDAVLRRLHSQHPQVAEVVEAYRESGTRLLPVILSGEEGELTAALGRALERALCRAQITVHPPTVYRAALNTIAMWANEFPGVHAKLEKAAKVQYESGLAGLVAALEAHDVTAYKRFADLYRKLAAGALFHPYEVISPAETYSSLAEAVQPFGYNGLLVLYDEFGRVLETRATEPLGHEAKVLQDLAEAANRSGSAQMQILLITHKSPSLYAHGLPDELWQEWRKIEGRFRHLNLVAEPEIGYRLIAAAISQPNPAAWEEFLAHHSAIFDRLSLQAVSAGLYDFVDGTELRSTVVEGSYPLHPLTTYCLPRLSQRVAQNERTLFTFMSSSDEHSLDQFLSNQPLDPTEFPLVLLDGLYDYFADAIRGDTTPGGTHGVWSMVQSALDRIGAEDELAISLVKTLGVICAIGTSEPLRPTTELLSFAMAPDKDASEVDAALGRLRDRRLLIFRRSSGQWEFFNGSDIDLGHRIGDLIRDRPASVISLRLLLERVLPPRHYAARRYNDEHGMTRFFWSLYRTPGELASVRDWQTALEELGFADGVIVYVLSTSREELSHAEALARQIEHPRVLVALPPAPLPVRHLLEELYALQELKADPGLLHDDPRVGQELTFLMEDTTEQLYRILASLIDPARGQRWFQRGQELDRQVRSVGSLCRLVSEICASEFWATPRIYNEAFNRREPTVQQWRASEKVIDSILRRDLGPTLGISGRGPEIAIIQSSLRAHGILAEVADGWRVGRPDSAASAAMAAVWDVIDDYLRSSTEKEVPFRPLIERLQQPPFGLRLGVVPVLIAAVLRGYIHVATVSRGGQPVNPLTGSTLTELCQRPELFSLHLDQWDDLRAVVLRALETEVAAWIGPDEQLAQPLRSLGTGLVRWLQALPRYARDTATVSSEAARLRYVARLSATDPARALLHELPDLLDSGADADRAKARLREFMDELTTAFHKLERRLERSVAEALGEQGHGVREALVCWLRRIEVSVDQLDGHLLDDAIGDGMLALSRDAGLGESDLTERLALLLAGIPLRDWTDTTEADAASRLRTALEGIERELVTRSSDNYEGLAEVSMQLPGQRSSVYRFRDGDLSPHGKLLLQNLRYTLQSSGRMLAPEERRRIALELLRSLLETRDRAPTADRA